MSIHRKPEKAVPVLLARLHTTKERLSIDADNGREEHPLDRKFKDIEKELNDMTDLFPTIKRWEKNVMTQLCELEQELDDDIFNRVADDKKINDKLDLIGKHIAKLKSLVSWVDTRVTEKLSTMSTKSSDDLAPRTASLEWLRLQIEDKIFNREALSARFHHRLESSEVKICLLSLSIFPKNSVIKKKPIIYWWMAEGLLVAEKGDATAEEVGEQFLQELLSEGFIVKSSENSFMVYPWIHRMLIQIPKEKNCFLDVRRRAFLGQQRNDEWTVENLITVFRNDEWTVENLITVFNVNKQYLEIGSDWLTGLKKVVVLQLGRWQDCATHHIEVEDERVLKGGLGSQKHLKYLSLRGISRIVTLPASIYKLISLQILDLRACHNLENIPQGISALKNLTHLDVSECYLLKSMPKGLDQLLALQVVKGFLISRAAKNSCKISDLALLKSLRKLSIRVGNQDEAQQKDQLGSLGSLPKSLTILSISWGVISPTSEVGALTSLPSTLTKFDLRMVPFAKVPEWLDPITLPNLVKLYINGGKLNTLVPSDIGSWESVKYVRLKNLKDLYIDSPKLKSLFPQCLNLEKVNCLEDNLG